VADGAVEEEVRPASSAAGRLIERAIRVTALAGGLLLAALAAMQVTSIVLRAVTSKPIPGDFELIQIGSAVVVFCFLPMALYYRHNFAVTLFTDRLPIRARRGLRAFGSIILLIIAALILWRTAIGGGDLRAVGEHTMVLQFRLWWAFVPIVAALVVLVIAAAAAALRDVRETST
jgi:TRAP-type C4-dicarboxylate transport system permease small subunit